MCIRDSSNAVKAVMRSRFVLPIRSISFAYANSCILWFSIVPLVFILESLIAYSSARLNNKHGRLSPCRSPVRAVSERTLSFKSINISILDIEIWCTAMHIRQ